MASEQHKVKGTAFTSFPPSIARKGPLSTLRKPSLSSNVSLWAAVLLAWFPIPTPTHHNVLSFCILFLCPRSEVVTHTLTFKDSAEKSISVVCPSVPWEAAWPSQALSGLCPIDLRWQLWAAASTCEARLGKNRRQGSRVVRSQCAQTGVLASVIDWLCDLGHLLNLSESP